MIALSHPTGNMFVRALLAAFERSETDYQFFTTLAIQPSESWPAFFPGFIQREIQRRSFNVSAGKVRQHPGRELGRLLAGHIGLQSLVNGEDALFSIDRVYKGVDRWVASELRARDGKGIDAIYAYEDGARESFAEARVHGIKCHYELPIAYWETSRRLLDEEAQRLPKWEPTLVGTRDSDEKLERKTAELSLADSVICPSHFVLRSIPESMRRGKLCSVVEFGSPAIRDVPDAEGKGSKLKVLFAGSMSQRKGLADVFAAMKLLRRSDIELIVMGSPVVSMEFYRKEYRDFIHEKPRPHGEFVEFMSRCDVLVLPSIVEGRALVQQEAMSCGLPIIVTKNAGGEDLVDEGVTGFLVPIRSPEAIADRIEWCAVHRSEVKAMGTAAKLKSGQYSWNEYGQKILSVIQALEVRETPHLPFTA